jgi:hypothetical protein
MLPGAPKAITDVLNRFSKEITESKRARKMPRCKDGVLSTLSPSQRCASYRKTFVDHIPVM